MSALSPPPKDPLERSRDQNIIGRMLLTRLVSLIVAAWVDNCYPDGRDDVREMMLALDDDATEARAAGNTMEADGCDRARDELSSLWAQMTDRLLGPENGLPAWAGVADRLWDSEPAAPIDYEP